MPSIEPDINGRAAQAAWALYAAGPWGEMVGWQNGGTGVWTDSHKIEVYQQMAKLVLELAYAEDEGA